MFWHVDWSSNITCTILFKLIVLVFHLHNFSQLYVLYIICCSVGGALDIYILFFYIVFVCTSSLTLSFLSLLVSFPSSPSLFPFLPPPSGSGVGGEESGGSAPRGAQDVAFPGEHLQPPGVHPGCSSVPVEHQTLHHLSGKRPAGRPGDTREWRTQLGDQGTLKSDAHSWKTRGH